MGMDELEHSQLRAEVEQLRRRVAELERSAQRAAATEEELRASKELLQLVLDTIPQFVFWKDRDSVYTGCNRNFARAAGVAEVADIVGKTDYDLAWKPSEADFFRECDRRVMENDAAEYHIIEPQLQADGKQAWLDTNKVPIHDAAGNVVGILGTYEDITERKRAEDELEASRENLRITLDSIGDAVIATDARGVVTRVNRVAEQLTGWSADAAVDRPLTDVFRILSGETRAPQDNPVTKVLAEGCVVGLANHTILVARDGAERQIADSGAPIRDRAGEIVGVVLVFRDVTREYEIEAQLRQSQKLESIGQLAGGVAHDFNNTLTGILGAAELLARALSSRAPELEFVKLITDSARRAAELTESLLAFSRKGTLEMAALDAHRSIGTAVDLLRRSIDKNVELIYEPRAEQTVLLGDDTQLQHAILNLGLNARDALADGGRLEIRTANVTLTAEDEAEPLEPGAYLEVAVEDDGSGIPAGVLDRIFEPFFTTKPVGEGTGLGLAAVYGAITRHGGAIRVFSQEGLGTKFKIYLPLDPDTEVTEVPPPLQLAPARGLVLVVDDDAIVRVVAKGLLLRLGCEVLLAADGRQALKIYQDRGGEIDLVLLDLVMPGWSGRDTFLRLRSVDPTAKIVFSSGFSQGARIEDVLSEGALGFLKKPYDLEQLSAAIRPHLPAAAGAGD